DQVDREGGERDQAAEQARTDKGAVARGRQRVLLNRRMNQRVDVLSNRSEQTHVPAHARRPGTRSPYWLAGSCQRRLKRTLRRGGRSCGEAWFAPEFPGVRPSYSRGMVNGRLPGCVSGW